MSFENIAWMTAIDMLVFFSVFFGGSFILSQIQKSSNRLIIKVAGYRGMLAVACPGVIVHESSHYALCHLFLHKVTRVRFFEVNPASGSLGYVNHSYNPYSLYHQLGNFFIGMAPLIGGSFAIYFLVNYFLSTELSNPFEPSENYDFNMATTLFNNVATNFDFFANTTISILSGLWSFVIYSPWYGLLLFYFMLSIALHAAPSRSDLHGAVRGGVTIVLLAFVLNSIALYFFSCCEEGQVTYWLVSLKVWIVYAEIVMMNLICFTLALSTIGFGILLTIAAFLTIIRKVSGTPTMN